MGKLRALFHPVMVFIGVQIAWIVLMAVWINWYLENNLAIKEFAQKIRPDLFTAETAMPSSWGRLCSIAGYYRSIRKDVVYPTA